MSNPNPSPENQWKKGQSGNPKGRPKQTESIRYYIKQHMGELYGDFELDVDKAVLKRYSPDELREKTLAEVAALNHIAKHIRSGNESLIEEVDGKQPEHIKTEDITVHVPDQQEQQAMLDKFKYDIPSSKEEEGEDKIQ
ncbi:MAG: hypothetical protein GY853_16880 [PVC group bacterium]|nr:hypothetical protein [PVC group bacterium]